MALSRIGMYTSSTDLTISQNTTVYGQLTQAPADEAMTTTTGTTIPVGQVFRVREFTATCSTNSFSGGNNITVAMLKNGSSTGMPSITVPTGSTGTFTSSTESGVQFNDSLAFSVTVGAFGAGSVRFQSITAVIECLSTGQLMYFGAAPLNASTIAVSTDSTTFYSPVSGAVSGSNITEAVVEVFCDTAGTLKDFYVCPTANTRSTDTVFTVRKNNADTGLTATVTGSSSAVASDLVNTVSVAAGDKISIKIVTSTGGGTLSLRFTRLTFIPTNTTKVQHLGSNFNGQARVATGTATGTAFLGGLGTGSFTTFIVGQHCTFSNLRAYISANTYTGTAIIGLAKNGVPLAAPIINLTAGQIGAVVDATSSTVFAPGDTVSAYIQNGSSGTITLSSMSLLETKVAARVPVI